MRLFALKNEKLIDIFHLMFYGVYIDMHTITREEENCLESWKQAILLAKFELRNSKKALLTLSILLITYVTFMVLSARTYVETGFVLFDVFFLLITGIAVIWAKPKDFQLQKIGGMSAVNPYFVMLNQLPIPKGILIKNRFVIYYAYAVPFHTLFLMLIYVFSETIRAELTVTQYIAFSLIWISFGVYWGSIYPASDVGDASNSSTFKVIVYLILFMAIVGGGIAILQAYTGVGVIYWTMLIAKKWPFLSSLVSVTAAGLSTIYWLSYANKNMKKVDYSI